MVYHEDLEKSFNVILEYLTQSNFKLRTFHINGKTLPIDLFFTSKKEVFYLMEKYLTKEEDLNNFVNQFEYDFFENI